MAINLSDSILIGQQKPVDDRYFNQLVPYTSVAEANSLIPVAKRHIGLFVNVDDDLYWYKGGIADGDLKPFFDSIPILNFINLGDVPNSYSGANGYAVRVNLSGTSLEFVEFPTSLPDGGSEGFVLRKNSNLDGDADWYKLIDDTIASTVTTWSSQKIVDTIMDIEEGLTSNLNNHISDTSNPHGTTLEQVRTANNTIAGDINMNGNRLNNLAAAVDNNDAVRKIEFDSLKSSFKNVIYNSVNGVITFTDHNGDTYGIDLPIENLFQNASYNSTTKTLTITTNAGGTVDVPLSDLVDLPEIQVSDNANPGATPSTGQRLYLRADNGNYWIASAGAWVGPYLSFTEDRVRATTINNVTDLSGNIADGDSYTNVFRKIRTFIAGIAQTVRGVTIEDVSDLVGNISVGDTWAQFVRKTRTLLNGKLTGSAASDAETQITTAVTEDNKFVSRLKLFNWFGWVTAASARFKLSFLSGTGSRLVMAGADGTLSAPLANTIVERIVQDADIIAAITAEITANKFTRATNFMSAILPAGGKTMYSGQEYFNAPYLYRAVYDNYVVRLNNITEVIITTDSLVQLKSHATYIATGSALQTFLLPSKSAEGEIITIHNAGTGGIKVTQNTAQSVKRLAANTTVGAAGYLQFSETQGTTVELTCILADTAWLVTKQIGTITLF